MLASMHFVCTVAPLFCFHRIYGSYVFAKGIEYVFLVKCEQSVKGSKTQRFYNSKILKYDEKFRKRKMNKGGCINWNII